MKSVITLIFIAAFISGNNTFIPNTFAKQDIELIGPEYGKYCGYKVTDKYGAKPIDELDRVCQLHDICVTSIGLLNCFCNEQLYYLVSNIRPKSQTVSKTKDSILSWIYKSIILCNTNYYWFDNLFSIAPFEKNNAGYFYIPFYPTDKDKRFIIESSRDAFIITFNDTSSYQNFTISMGNFERINFSKFNLYPLQANNITKFEMKKNETTVIFNPQPFDLIVFIKEICIN